MADEIQDILQQCLELLREGTSLEECLGRYPEEAEEVEPLLQVALAAKSEFAPAISPAVRTRVRGRMLVEWDRRYQRRRWSWHVPIFLPRWAAVAASVVLVVALSGIGSVAAAGGAVPGDPLYPVKEFREAAQLWFTRSPEARVAMYNRLVKERVEEVRTLAAREQTRSNAISLALRRLDSHLTALNALVDENVHRRTAGPPAADSDFLEELREVVTGQKSAEGVLKGTLDQVPTEARGGLLSALEAIQQARERVGAALEAVGPPAGGE